MIGTEMLNTDYSGFQVGNQDVFEALTKALEAGSGVDAAAFVGGRAMIPESLDKVLVNVLWDQNKAKLFKALKKKPVPGPVHQFTRRTGVGDSDGAWVAEGGDSTEKDQTLARVNVTMKYLQTLRKATLQATLANMLEDAIASEKMAGTLWLIKQVETILFEGDSAIITEEPDGLRKSVWGNIANKPDNVIDVHGKKAFSVEFENAIADAARVVEESYGTATHLFGSLKMMYGVQQLLRDRYRINAEKSGGGSVLGAPIFTKYPTVNGEIELTGDLFVKERPIPRTSSITADRPSQPTLANVLTPADATNSNFKAADAGDYYYAVAEVNEFGQSLVSAEIAVTGIAVGDKVTIEITDGVTAGTGYYIFRSKKGASASSTLYFCGAVAKGTSGSAISVDWNNWMPGCSDAFVLGLDPMDDAIEWEQWLPMMKFDLFPTNAAVFPFLMLLFGALGVKKPEHHVIIRNICPSDLNWYE